MYFGTNCQRQSGEFVKYCETDWSGFCLLKLQTVILGFHIIFNIYNI